MTYTVWVKVDCNINVEAIVKKVFLKAHPSYSLPAALACLLVGLVPAILACGILPSQINEMPASETSLLATETSLSEEQPTDIGAATLTPIPTDAVPMTPPYHAALLYQTPFGPAWPVVTGDKASGKPVSGGYQIDITQPWAFYFYSTHVQQAAFFAEITVTPQQCPAGSGGYGMIFHYQSEAAYRFATIWCSGRYSLMERTGPSSAVTLAEDALPEAIDPSTGEHIVGLRAAANTLTLYVDGIPVGQVDVTTMPAGDVGPYAETTGKPMSVLFSHLSVYYAE